MTGSNFVAVMTLAVGSLVAASLPAEASRIDLGLDDRGVIIWDGSDDVRSMTLASGSTTLTPFTLADGSQIRVDVTENVPEAYQIKNVWLLITGAAPQADTVLHSICPSAASLSDCDPLNVSMAFGTPADVLTAQHIVAFSGLLVPNALDANNIPAFFTINPSDYGAINALLPLSGELRFGLVAQVVCPDDNPNPANCIGANGNFIGFDMAVTPAAVPEPASLVLLTTGLGAAALRRRAARRG